MRQIRAKMNRTFVYLTLLVMALAVVAGISGCGQTASSNEAQQMSSDVSGINTADQDLGTLDTDLNDSALADIENLL